MNKQITPAAVAARLSKPERHKIAAAIRASVAEQMISYHTNGELIPSGWSELTLEQLMARLDEADALEADE